MKRKIRIYVYWKRIECINKAEEKRMKFVVEKNVKREALFQGVDENVWCRE